MVTRWRSPSGRLRKTLRSRRDARAVTVERRRPSENGRQGPPESVGKCRDRAILVPERICNSRISPKLHSSVYPRRCAM